MGRSAQTCGRVAWGVRKSVRRGSFGARSTPRYAAEREDLNSHVLTDKAGLSAIRKQVRADLSRSRIEPPAAFDCLVALTEACTQALLHTDEEESRGPRISWEVGGDEALFYIRDYSSRAWARASHPSSTPSAAHGGLEQRLEDLGLQLMRGLMDDVRIEMHGSGTTVVLVKRFGRSQGF